MKNLIFLLSITLLISCKQQSEEKVAKSNQEAISELQKTDSLFSALSAIKGMNKAFLAYADSNVIKLMNRSHPVIGIGALREFYKTETDTGFVLTWRTSRAEVAASQDLGYTFGDWEWATKTEQGKDTIFYGNYVSIWKKNAAGDWKFVLDGGNGTPKPIR